MVFDPSAALGQFTQLDHLGLIGIDEAGHFAVEGGKLALQTDAFLFRPDIHRWIPAPLLIFNWLRVFRRADTVRLGSDGRPQHHTRAVH
jgi:hypothetical protein